jgi:3-carboxy-cis,cis-muconate cycloisomerase
MSRATDPAADVGLLSPVWAGTVAEAMTSDAQIAGAMSRFEVAVANSLAEHGLADPVSVEEPVIDVRRLALDAVPPGNPTIPLVAALRRGTTDGMLHQGLTSQDVVDSALMMVASSVLLQVESDLVVLAERLSRLADSRRHVPCVARTLTQQAMPTTLGFRAAGWLAGVHDALLAVRSCRPLPVSLGGPVGTLAGFGPSGPAVVATVAERLGLEAPVVSWHTRRSPLLSLASTLVAVGEGCGRMCADLLLMAQTEVGEASDGSGGSSSAMAHKANPTRAVLVASAAQQLPFLLASVASSGAAGSERPAGAWHAEWQPLRTMLRLAGAAAERTCRLADDLSFDTQAMRRNLDRLVDSVGEDTSWVSTQTAHVDVWIDRVLARHEQVVG